MLAQEFARFVVEGNREDHDDAGEQEEEVEHEAYVVLDPYAVVCPWAVMIKSLHALATDSAMLASRCADDFTFRAELNWVN